MSDAHAHEPAAESHDSGDGMLKTVGKVFETRKDPQAKSLIDGVVDTTKASIKLATEAGLTALDAPLFVAQGLLAAPNNIVALTTKIIDEQVVKRMDTMRASIRKGVNETLKTTLGI